MAKAEAIVNSYKKIKSHVLAFHVSQSSLRNQHRKAPPIGWFKVNVNAATKQENLVAGLGAIIRNSERKFVAAAQKQTTYYGDVTAVEAKAIKLGIETAVSAGCMPPIIESDCREAISLVNRKNLQQNIKFLEYLRYLGQFKKLEQS